MPFQESHNFVEALDVNTSDHRNRSFMEVTFFDPALELLNISQILLENTCVGLKACNLIKNRLHHRCFPVKFTKYLRKSILKNICERLLLDL